MKRFLSSLLLISFFLVNAMAQVAPAFESASQDLRDIITTCAAIICAIIGLVGIGRAAYKFAHGDTDAVTALVTGIVALCLGAIAATF